MIYRLLFVLLFFTTNLFSEYNDTINKNTFIKTSLEAALSPIDKVGDTFSLIIEDYIYDSTYRKILIPKNKETFIF